MTRTEERTKENMLIAAYETLEAIPEAAKQNEIARDLLNFAQGWKARDLLQKQQTA